MAKKSRKSNAAQQRIAERIRTACARRGWSLIELAHRSGVSRTTLYHLLRSHTDRPHNETLQRVAAALELPIEALLNADHRDIRPPPAALAGRASQAAVLSDPNRRRDFDAATNPAVEEVRRDQPQLFDGWSPHDFDELSSLFGTGGALTPRGVELAAEAINHRRETIHKLQIVLETHLRKEVSDMIDMFYRMVQPPQMREADPRPGNSE